MKATDAEIDLHDLKPSQIRWELLPFLDRGYAQGWERVHVIHGEGTGTLRDLVWEILDGLEYVESYRLGYIDEGGRGLTVVDYTTEK